MSKVTGKSYYTCPNCDNSQLREIIFNTRGEFDMEICSCGYPEGEGRLMSYEVSA